MADNGIPRSCSFMSRMNLPREKDTRNNASNVGGAKGEEKHAVIGTVNVLRVPFLPCVSKTLLTARELLCTTHSKRYLEKSGDFFDVAKNRLADSFARNVFAESIVGTHLGRDGKT